MTRSRLRVTILILAALAAANPLLAGRLDRAITGNVGGLFSIGADR